MSMTERTLAPPASVEESAVHTGPAPDARMSTRVPRATWIFMIVVAMGSFFVNINLSDVTNVNEGQRLLPSLEMIERGDWVVPRLDGLVYINKPPLVYWIFAAAYRLNGQPSALAARIPSALACLLAVLLVAWIGRRHQSELAGLFAGLFLATNYYFRHKAQIAEIDPFLTLAVLAATYGFWRAAEPGESRQGLWLLGAVLAAAAAVMLKGPVYFLFLLASLPAARLAMRTPWARLGVLAALLLLLPLLLAAPWCVMLVNRLGWGEVWRIFHREALVRVVYSTPINSGPIYYYVQNVSVSFLPWTWLLFFWGARRFKAFHLAQAGSFFRFTAWTTLFSFILFSLVKGKETEYLLPVFPLLALMAGSVMDWLALSERDNAPQWRWTRRVMLLFALLGLIAPVALATSLGPFLRMSWLVLAMLLAGAVAAAFCLYLVWTDGRRIPAVLTFALMFSLLNAAICDGLTLRTNTGRSSKPLAAALAAENARGLRAYRWLLNRPHDVWYLREVTQPLPTQMEALDQIARNTSQTAGVLVRKKDVKKLKRKYGRRIEFTPDPRIENDDLTFAMMHPVTDKNPDGK